MNLNFIFQALDGTGDAGNLSGTYLWGYPIRIVYDRSWSLTINTI